MQNFTLRQLEYLIASVDHGSIADAAAILNVSQPTISVAIAKLEAQFNVQLLLRHQGKGVTATTSAATILGPARRLLADAEDLEKQAVQTGSTLSGNIALGSFSTLSPSVLPGLLSSLSHAYPDISVQIREGSQSDLLEDLISGRIDTALVYDIELPSNLRTVPLSVREPYVALPACHPLTNKSEITLTELVNEPLILLDVAPSRDYFLGIFQAAGLEPKIGHCSPSLELVRGLVGQGLGYSILVTRPQADVTYDGKPIVVRPLSDPAKRSTLVLASLADLKPTKLIRAFEDVARSTLTNETPD